MAAVAKRIRSYAGRDKEMRDLIALLERDATVLSAPMAEPSRKEMYFSAHASMRFRDLEGKAIKKPRQP